MPTLCIRFRYHLSVYSRMSGHPKNDNGGRGWSRHTHTHTTNDIQYSFDFSSNAANERTAHLWQTAIWPTCFTIFAVCRAVCIVRSLALNSVFRFVSFISPFWQSKSESNVMHVASLDWANPARCISIGRLLVGRRLTSNRMQRRIIMHISCRKKKTPRFFSPLLFFSAVTPMHRRRLPFAVRSAVKWEESQTAACISCDVVCSVCLDVLPQNWLSFRFQRERTARCNKVKYAKLWNNGIK